MLEAFIVAGCLGVVWLVREVVKAKRSLAELLAKYPEAEPEPEGELVPTGGRVVVEVESETYLNEWETVVSHSRSL